MTTYLEQLRGDLVAGIHHDRRRTRRVAAAATAALLLAALPAALATRVPDRALAVTRTADTIELRIADASAGAAAMTRELHDAGVKGEVQVVPAEPGQIGRWVAVVEVARRSDGGKETVRLSRIETTPERVSIPVSQARESTGRFLFLAGRAPRPGEEPAARDGKVRRELVR